MWFLATKEDLALKCRIHPHDEKGGNAMCDTMVALGNATLDGSTLFAKNSDRQPNEPHIIVRVPRKHYKPGTRVKCTYIEIEQAEETYEVLLLKPSWIWGAEMGWNEFGLTIGNEAVFTKERKGPDSLIGMDMLRIALERCKTSEEALDLLTALLEKYGQGGNCGYEKPFTYHNSFLIADKTSAWVLETAGKYWAAEKVKDVRSISNCLTIGSHFDRCHPDLIQHAIDKGWCRGEKDFHFARCYGDPLITHFSGAHQRYEASTRILQQEKGRITVRTLKGILRHHEEKITENPFSRSSLKSICMHGGFLYGDHTTGSYIVQLDEERCTHWVTGSSTPCLSVFKPLWMVEREPFTFTEEETASAVEYWIKRERLHRMILENRIPDVEAYIAKRDDLENKLDEMASSVQKQGFHEDGLLEIMAYAKEKEEELIDETCRTAIPSAKIKGNPYFRYYWRKQNRKLGSTV